MNEHIENLIWEVIQYFEDEQIDCTMEDIQLQIKECHGEEVSIQDIRTVWNNR